MATTGVDLTPWGYIGCQLPKVYTFTFNGTGDYLPYASYKEFKSIISGSITSLALTSPLGLETSMSQMTREDASQSPFCSVEPMVAILAVPKTFTSTALIPINAGQPGMTLSMAAETGFTSSFVSLSFHALSANETGS